MMADWDVRVESIGHGSATLQLPGSPRFLRPGDTVSGPVMMGLADVALYAALLGAIGPVPLAVTSNLTINFLRKPGAGGIRAEAMILKLGRRLATGEVRPLWRRFARAGRPCDLELRHSRRQRRVPPRSACGG